MSFLRFIIYAQDGIGILLQPFCSLLVYITREVHRDWRESDIRDTLIPDISSIMLTSIIGSRTGELFMVFTYLYSVTSLLCSFGDVSIHGFSLHLLISIFVNIFRSVDSSVSHPNFHSNPVHVIEYGH